MVKIIFYNARHTNPDGFLLFFPVFPLFPYVLFALLYLKTDLVSLFYMQQIRHLSGNQYPFVFFQFILSILSLPRLQGKKIMRKPVRVFYHVERNILNGMGVDTFRSDFAAVRMKFIVFCHQGVFADFCKQAVVLLPA